MTFIQERPRLANQYDDDSVLAGWLAHHLSVDLLTEMEPSLDRMGELAAGRLYEMQQVDREREPVLTRWDAWGGRVDRIELTPLWEEAHRVAAREGVVATAYDGGLGAWNRVHQFALAYLFIPSTDIFGCLLAMTDGAARTILREGDDMLARRLVPRLTSRDPDRFWTSGQWMTELTGGSDVGRSTTAARFEDGEWRLYGRKWFTSAIASPMALTLARPEGNPEGGRGLALFQVETRDRAGRMRGITVDRLKDKLGTRKLPTAEIHLDGTPAVLVGTPRDGVRRIAPMLNITRTWNAVTSVAYMRRGIALARDYARRREAFGSALIEKPLHLDTLAGMEAELRAAFHLTFLVVRLLGLSEADRASEDDHLLLRILTPVAKLTTAKQAVAVCSEVVECFGGAGYVEDTGISALLRDAQVLPIWEGTTNVLSLDVLRAVGEGDALEAVVRRVVQCVEQAAGTRAEPYAQRASLTVEKAAQWLRDARETGLDRTEAGARRFALTLGRSVGLALLAEHAAWALRERDDPRGIAACDRFARNGFDLIGDPQLVESEVLGRG